MIIAKMTIATVLIFTNKNLVSKNNGFRAELKTFNRCFKRVLRGYSSKYTRFTRWEIPASSS